MRRRILSSLLALMMVVALLPLQVFADESEVTRIQWLQKLTETFDMTVEEDNYPDNYYSDISSNDSYYRDVMVATEFGLIDQEPGTELKPNEPATREFAAHTLNFCLGYELDEGISYTFSDSESLTYADDAQIAVNRSWFALVDGKFMPEQAITNAEMTAMLADAAEVLIGRNVDTGAESTYTFADGVKEIPESTDVAVSEDDSSLTVTGYTETLSAGDIIAVHGVFPTIYSVTAVAEADDAQTLTVTKLDADEYILSMDTQGSVDADPTDVEAADGTTVTYIFSNGEETTSAVRAKALLKASGANVKIKDVKLDKTIYGNSGVKVSIHGGLSKMSVDYKVTLGKYCLDPYAMVKINGTASVGCTASFTTEATGLPSSVTLAYVPIAGFGKIEVIAKIDISGEISLDYKANFTVGFEYADDSGFSAIKTFSAGSFSLQGQISMKAGVQVKTGLADVPLIEGYVYAEAGGQMKMNFSTVDSDTVKYCTDTSAWVYAKIGYSVGISGIKTWSDSYDIWNMNNSPLLSHNHFENGVSTNGVCTVGSDCIKNGYGKNGYTTSTNSKYYNYGGSSASSTGIGSDSKPYTTYTYSLDDYKNATITSYKGNVSALMVPKTLDGYTVTVIGPSAFKGNSSLHSVYIPEGITSIGDYAFQNCINLGTIEFPESLIEIGAYAFRNCNSLTNITLPSNLQTLEYGAFYGCTNLQSVWIPKTITNNTSSSSVGPFYDCEKLKSVTFAEGITNIPSGLFTGCTGIESIEIPDTVTKILSDAFKNSSIQSVKIGSGVTTIGNSAFYGCKSLTEINLPDALTSIGAYAFRNCNSLTNITLPSKITRIEDQTFYNCNSLKTAELPEMLKSIGAAAFYGCAALEAIVIPDNTYLIENEAFENCSALKSVKTGTGLRTVQYDAFRNCDALTEFIMPEGVTTIGNNVFYDCDALEMITIPNSVTSLGTGLFSDCEKLKDVNLGTGITTIPASMFYQCPKLESIVLPFRVTAVGDKAFANSTSLTSVTIPRSVTSISSNAFSYPAIMTIYGVAGTYAETFANDNSIKFVDKQVNATKATLDKTTLTINKGSSAKLYLSADPADFTDEVNWKSADTSIATIADDGTVKAVGVGTTTIKVTVGNVSASCAITVIQPVTSISLNKSSLSLEALDTYQLTATANPTTAYDKTVKWTSSDTSVATVSEDGLVTAVGKGTATITATATAVEGVSKSCTVTVTNNAVVASEVSQLESPHNYSNDCSDIWIYTLADASAITVTFDERTTIEDGFDYLYIYNANGDQIGKYTGTELAGKSIDIDGNTVKIKLVSDSGGNEWGFKVTDVKAASDTHVHSYTAVVTAPTCTAKGYTTYTCSCGNSYKDNYTEALGHNYSNGSCTRCGAADPDYSAPHTHTYKSVVTAPTCTSKGYTTYTCTCSSCGYSYVGDYVDALGHDSQTENAKAATCTEDGYTGDKVCKRCGAETEKGTVIGALGHDYNEGKCTRCGAADPDYAAPHTHSYTSVVTAPTCTAKGYTTYTCSCGNSYVDNYTDALGHSYTSGKCTRCGAADPNYKVPTAVTFSDVAAKAYYANAVQWAVANGITNGTDDTHFSPDQGCTRAQVVTFLWRAAGSPTVSGNAGFVDVKSSDYYYDAVKWAVANGITNGTDATHFSPNATCTRGQVVTFMYRAEGSPATSGSCGFVDVKSADYYYNAVIWAVANEITNGTDATHFSPSATCTRAQVVTFLYRNAQK